ncbi:MAG: hypothetical protein FJW30_12335 [Acidobacteria bacterium]|nr:hypothetical protein [Acidobacteriota bacterium]
MQRRHFLITGACAWASTPPVRTVKIERVFKSPDGFPNALEATKEGLWLGEQSSDIAYLLDWKTGKVLKKVETESSNTSGIAFGGGYLWMAANGFALGRSKKSTDHPSGAILKVDPNSGKTIAEYPVPGGGGGLHGLEYADGFLWTASHRFTKLGKVDVRDGKFELVHSIPATKPRSHGMAFVAPNTLWCMFSTDRQIHKLDATTGEVQEVIQLGKDDPDPHGMCLWKGYMYYCDAGIAPGGLPNESSTAGWIVRFKI